MEKNNQTHAYLRQAQYKQHQIELLEFIKEEGYKNNPLVLDIGCAGGKFLELIGKNIHGASCYGIDLSEELILEAKTLIPKFAGNIKLESALSYVPDVKFDLIIASGVLSIFEDFEKVLERWVSWLNDCGSLYIFGTFNKQDVDVIIKFRNNFCPSPEWESGLTTYSISTVKKFLENKNLNYLFRKFNLNIEIPKDVNPIRTHTIRTISGETLLVNGANIITDFYFLKIQK